MKPKNIILLAIVVSLGISESSAQKAFSRWSDFEYVYLSYTSNTWTTSASTLAGKMTYDAWNHVGETKNFLASKIGWNRILPDNFEDWPTEVVNNRHRVLFIDIWCDGNYTYTQYGPSGPSYTYWRFRDLTHMLKVNKNNEYTGNLGIDAFSHSMGLNANRDHQKIQQKWEQAHGYDSYSFTGSREESILKELEELGYNGPSVSAEPELTKLNVDSIKNYVDASAGSCIYGIYRIAPGANKSCGKYHFGVIDFDGEPTAVITKDIEISGTSWNKGEVKSRFVPTASSKIFIADWKMANRSSTEGYATCEGGLLTIEIPAIGGEEETIPCNYIKTYPLGGATTNSKSAAVGANVGDAISAGSAVVIDDLNQFIVTNFHVVKERSSFKVEQGGVLHEAVLLKTDEKNDLALLRIMSENIRLKALAISMDDGLGDRVYSAGYPRVFQMGDEIKVTEGVISSMSFLSDPSRFQTSVPITNGNSGGALLDESGNLVGITQGGWRPDANTENVNAAVKSLYVVSLAQTEATCEPSLVQKKGELDFSEIENSVLPIFVFD